MRATMTRCKMQSLGVPWILTKIYRNHWPKNFMVNCQQLQPSRRPKGPIWFFRSEQSKHLSRIRGMSLSRETYASRDETDSLLSCTHATINDQLGPRLFTASAAEVKLKLRWNT